VEFLGSTQTEQLKAIGAKLSEARQQQSVTLEEIAAKTYIPLRLLGAIEAGKLEQLPEPVFIQGFIRRYADALGLDGPALSKEFSLQAPAVAPPPVESVPEPAPAPKPVVASVPVPAKAELRPVVMAAAPQSTPSYESEESSEGSAFKLPWLPIAAIVGLGALALILVNALNQPKALQTAQQSAAPKAAGGGSVPIANKPQAPTFSNPTVSASASPIPVASASPVTPAATASPVASPAASPSASPAETGPVQVKLNLTDESWVLVMVDGQTVFEGNLPKGTQKTFSGKKDIEVSSGNAGAVSVSYNNGAAKAIGEPGDVVTAKYPPTP
jgi:cytoskeleton protein RodZ